MKGNVQILAPYSGAFGEKAGQAFRDLGWKVDIFEYGEGGNKPRIYRRILRSIFLSYRLELVRISFNNTLLNKVIPRAREKASKLIVILKGDQLTKDVREQLSTLDAQVVCWAYDSLARCPEICSTASVASAIFYLDADDNGPTESNSYWLPLGSEGKLLSESRVPEYDVLFVGSIGGPYKRRRELLIRLAESNIAKNYKVGFIGATKSKFGNWLFKLNSNVTWISTRVSPELMLEYMSNAKVCVNIHQDDGGRPINPYFFMIPGVESCLVAEDRDYFSDWLTPGVDFLQFSDDDYLDVIENALSDEKSRLKIASSGCTKCQRNHSYQARVEYILSKLCL